MDRVDGWKAYMVGSISDDTGSGATPSSTKSPRTSRSTLANASANKGVKMLGVEGVAPSLATIGDGSYPLYITLYLAEIGMDIPGWDDAAGKDTPT